MVTPEQYKKNALWALGGAFVWVAVTKYVFHATYDAWSLLFLPIVSFAVSCWIDDWRNKQREGKRDADE